MARSDGSVNDCQLIWLAGVFTNWVRASRLVLRIGQSVNCWNDKTPVSGGTVVGGGGAADVDVGSGAAERGGAVVAGDRSGRAGALVGVVLRFDVGATGVDGAAAVVGAARVGSTDGAGITAPGVSEREGAATASAGAAAITLELACASSTEARARGAWLSGAPRVRDAPGLSSCRASSCSVSTRLEELPAASSVGAAIPSASAPR